MEINTKFKTFAFSCALFTALQANAKEFSYTENFDEPAITENADLPEGWTAVASDYAPIMRYAGTYVGTGAHSNNAVLGTLESMSARNDWAFSKAISLKKGTEYTVSYWLKAPGGQYPGDAFMTTVELKVGTAQSADAMTTSLGKTTKRYADWEQITYTFTPTEDGEYYFGFNLVTTMYKGGALGIDDFQITGDEAEGGETGGGETGGGTEQPGGGETAETVELLNMDFDNDDDFADGAKMPAGWISTGDFPFQRNTSGYFGTGTHSGNYVFGTTGTSSVFNRNEKVFTNMISMKTGKEYTFSFWLKAPGGANAALYYNKITTKVGTSQTTEGMTQTLGETPKGTVYPEWTKLEYKFTPENDGEYCFGLELTTELWNSGAVAFDDFMVTGPKENGGGTVDPGDDDDKETVELPYSQSFDNENKDYDGTSFLPKGWLATGSSSFVTANIGSMPARDGVYYLVAPESSVARDDRAYTPFFHLEKDVTYNAEFYLYMPGDADNEEAHSDFSFTVGTEQDSEFHTNTLLSLPEYQNSKWQKFTVPFVPEKTGNYCFSFALGGEAANAGEVCIDLFTLKAPGQIAKPVANFVPDAAYSTMESGKIVTTKDAPVRMINYSTDGETFEWTATGATPATSTEQEPSFSFPADGKYDITLKVTNAKGESTTSKTLDVKTVGSEPNSQFAIQEFSANDSQVSRDYIMSYDTDADGYDYVTGFNHYYHKLAQRFSMPAGDELEYTVSKFTFGCNFWQMTNDPAANDKQKPFSVVFYGEKDGRPDVDNVLARQDMTIEEAFPRTIGNSSFEMRDLNLKKPVTFKATGNFYVSLEFSPEMTIDVTGYGLYRSFCAFGTYRAQSKETTFFVLPEAVPEGSLTKPDGKFYPVDVYDSDFKGLGLQLMAWMTADDISTTQIAVTPDGQTAFAARLDGNQLTVSGTKDGDMVTVYDATGKIIAKKTANASSTALNVNAPAGLYIVATPAGTQKFVKK